MICERRFLRTGRAAGNLGRVNAMKRVFVIALLTLIWLGIVTGPAARKLLNVTTILVFPLRALTNFFATPSISITLRQSSSSPFNWMHSRSSSPLP
jgi:hypothetical protein